MRFCVVQLVNRQPPCLAVAAGGGIVPVDAPPSLRGALEQFGPERLLEQARQAIEITAGISADLSRAHGYFSRWFPPGHRPDIHGAALSVEGVETWLSPVPDPRTFRDFYAFEQHVRTARRSRGLDMIPEWYKFPVFYFSNPTTLRGHNQPVRKPAATHELDFELEIAAVIGRQVQDASGAAAEEATFGYTVLNDLSARDIQREEMKCQLGPAKGKDFATAVGPFVVTCDELADRRVGPGRYDLVMTARKNGREISRGNMRDIHFDFTQLVARASQDAPLFPGDLIGSGTVGTGCILELRPENTGGWLEPGDVIELEIDRIGTLRTPIV